MSGYFQQNELDDIVLPGVLQAYTKSAKNKAVRYKSVAKCYRLILEGRGLRLLVLALKWTGNSEPISAFKSLIDSNMKLPLSASISPSEQR